MCADYADLRAELMARYANDMAALDYRDVVRQKGGLSSFHIPTETIGHSIWRARYGNMERGDEHCRLQRKERLALGKHARIAGCKITRHAPTIMEKIGNFDAEFDELLKTAGWTRNNSRRLALEGLTAEIAQLEKDIDKAATPARRSRATSTTAGSSPKSSPAYQLTR